MFPGQLVKLLHAMTEELQTIIALKYPFPHDNIRTPNAISNKLLSINRIYTYIETNENP